MLFSERICVNYKISIESNNFSYLRAKSLEHRYTHFLGNRSSSSFIHRCLVNWLLLRCQRQTSRVKEAFVGFGYQKPNLTPAHLSLVKQSMLLRRVRKEPYLVQTERCGGETRWKTLALSGGPADLSPSESRAEDVSKIGEVLFLLCQEKGCRCKLQAHLFSS